MASLNQLVSEFAHAVGNPNSIPLRRNLRYAILHGRNELIRKSYENHKYVDKGLQQRIRVLLLMFLMVIYIIVKLLDFLQLNVLNKKFQSQLDLLITYLSNQLELPDILE